MNWKKAVYFVLAAVFVIGGMTVVIALSLHSKSVPKINLSNFDTPAAAGEAVGQRLWLELKTTPVVMFGVWPSRPYTAEAVAGFLAAAGADTKYDTVLVEPDLPGREKLPPGAIEISSRDETAKLADAVRRELAQGRRVAIVSPTMFSSKMIADGPADRLKREFGVDFISVSTLPFPYAREEEKDFEIQCDAGNDRTGIGPLTCASLAKARTIYRKKKNLEKYMGTLDQVGEKDYMFLLSPPRP